MLRKLTAHVHNRLSAKRFGQRGDALNRRQGARLIGAGERQSQRYLMRTRYRGVSVLPQRGDFFCVIQSSVAHQQFYRALGNLCVQAPLGYLKIGASSSRQIAVLQ